MRHNKKFNHLGRKSAHRKSMLSNMASSLIENKRISTTLAKAKALRTYVEPIITKAKNDTTNSRRVVFSHLQNKDAVSELFRDVAVKIGERPGGYTRILRTGNRIGDNAEMCIIELVDYNETMLASQAEGEKPKRKRSRRGTGKKVQSAAAEVKQKNVKKTSSVKEAKAAPAASEDNLTVEAKKDDAPVAELADDSASQVENPEKENDNQSEEKQD